MRRVYNLNSAYWAMDNIKKARLKLSRFADLNDPFELLGLNLQDRNARKVAKAHRDGHNENMGLLCFAGDWSEPVLWGHYAEKHTGICLGFNVPFSKLQQVHYADERLAADLLDASDPDNLPEEVQRQLMTTKSRGWIYEQEHRQLVPLDAELQNDNGFLFVPFSSELELSEVILGPNCKLDLHEVQREVCLRFPFAVTYKARLAFRSFHVVPDVRTIP